MVELIRRRVSYGLDLVDRLNGGPLIGRNRVTLETLAAPGRPDPVVFVLGRSRWVFEELQNDVTFTIDAEYYLTERRTVAAADLDGTLDVVHMSPRSGYPFPSSLTRVIGMARLASGLPVGGAAISVSPMHFIPATASFIAGPAIEARSADDGQYVVWFQPEPGLSDAAAEPTASRFSASATATIELDGVLRNVAGSIGDQDLVPEALNDADIIEMIEV